MLITILSRHLAIWWLATILILGPCVGYPSIYLVTLIANQN